MTVLDITSAGDSPDVYPDGTLKEAIVSAESLKLVLEELLTSGLFQDNYPTYKKLVKIVRRLEKEC